MTSAGYREIFPVTRQWPAYAWPGGYQLFYIHTDGGVICPKCANKKLLTTLDKHDSDFIVACEANYEDPELHCDHCSERIPSSYVEDQREEFYDLLMEVTMAQTGDERLLAEATMKAWVDTHPVFAGYGP